MFVKLKLGIMNEGPVRLIRALLCFTSESYVMCENTSEEPLQCTDIGRNLVPPQGYEPTFLCYAISNQGRFAGHFRSSTLALQSPE